MTGESVVFMWVICGAVWGGFLWCLWKNFKGSPPK